MTYSYNLVDEPWIPVVGLDGVSTAKVGLREALVHAHEWQGVYGETPLVAASVYRLLLALLYAIFGVPSSRRWEDLWRRGALDAQAVNAYLDKWHERFDLFHPERPFYQWPAKANREKTVIDMLPELASGGNATLFDHHTAEGSAFFLPDEAARALLLVQTFSVAGGGGLAPKESADAPWSRGCVFLVEGDNLFQTLLLNFGEFSISTNPADHPFWEMEDPFARRDVPLGIKDYLTWPTRALWLLPETSPTGQVGVREVRMGTGLKLAPEVLQPFYHYRRRPKDGKWLFQRFSATRALWRDSASFLKLRKVEKANDYRPPETLQWLADLLDESDVLEKHRLYRYMVFGMANNQAKVDFYREEHFPLPADYLLKPELVESLSDALNKADEVGAALGSSISRLATLLVAPNKEGKQLSKSDRQAIKDLASHWAAERDYWASLEVPFFELLEALPQNKTTALQRWKQMLREFARQALERAIRMTGEDAMALRAAVLARGQLEGKLKRIFDPENHPKGEAHERKAT